MSDIDILREMIKKTAKLSLSDCYYGKKQITLTEPQQANSSVTRRRYRHQSRYLQITRYGV